MCYYSIVIICIKFFSKINILCFHIKLLVELFPGDMQNRHMEDKSLSLSMPVVTEEDEENKSFSETEFTAPKRRRKQRTKSL